MSSEEMLTLSGFRIDAYVPALSSIIASPSSIDILVTACRAMASILDIFTADAVIEAAVSHNLVARLCDMLLNIEYMDVAELALRMFARMSKSASQEVHCKILDENALVALLQFMDFFSVDVQRGAARTACALCSNVSGQSWPKVEVAMPLIQNLVQSYDAEIVFSGCEALRRYVRGRS
jgi:E3 ubiquitin-protein ligase TRIP12